MKTQSLIAIGLMTGSGAAFAQLPAVPAVPVLGTAVPAAPALPDAALVTDAIASGQMMLTDALAMAGAPGLPGLPEAGLPGLPDAGAPELGTLDIDNDVAYETDLVSFSSVYTAMLPEQGGGEVAGSLMDQSFEIVYGGTLEELTFGYTINGEGMSQTISLTDPAANLPDGAGLPSLPGAPALPAL
jgi:hypothetical protein